MGDKIAILKNGVLQQMASPMELYRNPANSFVAGFLGTPAMNFIEASSVGGRLTIGGVAINGMPATPCDGAYSLGIRPENIDLSCNGQMDPLHGLVEQIELLGDHALVYVNWNGQTICCRTGIPDSLAEGAEIDFTLDLKCAKLFDVASGAAL